MARHARVSAGFRAEPRAQRRFHQGRRHHRVHGCGLHHRTQNCRRHAGRRRAFVAGADAADLLLRQGSDASHVSGHGSRRSDESQRPLDYLYPPHGRRRSGGGGPDHARQDPADDHCGAERGIQAHARRQQCRGGQALAHRKGLLDGNGGCRLWLAGRDHVPLPLLQAGSSAFCL